MDFEIWWLLGFPLFFALGWLAARVDIKQLLSESRALPSSYFKGLNFLINQQPDKAIEAFIEVVKVDPQTVELHFALGSLFRRRGEVDRAIRMHQNLVDRADLGSEQRLTALYELAQENSDVAFINLNMIAATGSVASAAGFFAEGVSGGVHPSRPNSVSSSNLAGIDYYAGLLWAELQYAYGTAASRSVPRLRSFTA